MRFFCLVSYNKNTYATFAINFFFSYLFLMKASIAESFVGLLKEMYILFLIYPLVFVDKKDR